MQKEQQFRELNAVKEEVTVKVIHNGNLQQISAYDLLVGDLLLVETGDILTCDGMLVEECEMNVDESHLTGESDSVDKSVKINPILYQGSKVRNVEFLFLI